MMSMFMIMTAMIKVDDHNDVFGSAHSGDGYNDDGYDDDGCAMMSVAMIVVVRCGECCGNADVDYNYVLG